MSIHVVAIFRRTYDSPDRNMVDRSPITTRSRAKRDSDKSPIMTDEQKTSEAQDDSVQNELKVHGSTLFEKFI